MVVVDDDRGGAVQDGHANDVARRDQGPIGRADVDLLMLLHAMTGVEERGPETLLTVMRVVRDELRPEAGEIEGRRILRLFGHQPARELEDGRDARGFGG